MPVTNSATSSPAVTPKKEQNKNSKQQMGNACQESPPRSVRQTCFAHWDSCWYVNPVASLQTSCSDGQDRATEATIVSCPNFGEIKAKFWPFACPIRRN